jgi:hypothetical protein
MKLLNLAQFEERSKQFHGGEYQPLLVRVAPSEVHNLRALCESREIVVFDSLNRQLRDLAAVRHPSGNDAERAATVDQLVASYAGCWICLPWERKISRLLEPEDYFEVITNRNRDKITLDEQRLLRTKRVGVMGLSVGGEAAVSIAQEHLCGHIVLADFDELDLSNLNRLHAGFDELGQNKAVLVARRIARIDPFLEVTVYQEGVTDDNVDEFLDGLHLLIEECDDLPMKFFVREKTRARGLNIVFAGDERGFLSVEPYGDYPELLPFHGRVDGPPPPKSAFDSAKEFWKVLSVWLGGWDALSARSRRSVDQIGTSLCGYPQLASEARFAAGQVGHVARRLLLGDTLPPSIDNLDLDDWLSTRAPT